MGTWPESSEHGTDGELAEAMVELSLCLASAIHRIDPAALAGMNFRAGIQYNRFLERDRKLSAEIMLRFGRALLDKDRFPDPAEPD